MTNTILTYQKQERKGADDLHGFWWDCLVNPKQTNRSKRETINKVSKYSKTPFNKYGLGKSRIR